jgi:soluble lytic murein transglycosylase-like protein
MHRLIRTLCLQLRLRQHHFVVITLVCTWIAAQVLSPVAADAVAPLVAKDSSSSLNTSGNTEDDQRTDQLSATYFRTIPELRFEGRPVPLIIRVAQLAAREQRESWITLHPDPAPAREGKLNPALNPISSLSDTEKPSDTELLGRFALAIEDGHLLHAQTLSQLIDSDASGVEGPIAQVFSLLKAEMLFKSNRPLEALDLLKKEFKDLQRSFPERLARLTFKAQVDARLWSAALATLKASEKHLYARDGSPYESDHQIKLAQGAYGVGATAQATALLERLARPYPVSPASETAYSLLLSQHSSAEALHQRLWPSLDSRVDHAAEIFKKLGLDTQFRSFAFTLSQREPNFQPPYADPDKLTLAEKANLLDQAVWFSSIREHQPFHEILKYLQSSKVYGPTFPQDKVKFLYARSLNSVKRPLDAADAYAAFTTSFPRSSFSGQATLNHLLSLHYGRRHMDVARAVEPARSKLPRQNHKLDWMKFWSLYLARENKQAEQWVNTLIRRRLSEETRSKYIYWKARILERTGRVDMAKGSYQALLTGTNQTIYSIFSQWRLNLLEKKSPERTGALDLAARSLPRTLADQAQIPLLIDTASWELIGTMTQAGLNEQARQFLRVQKTSGLKPNGLLELAGLAILAEDFNLASRLGRRAFLATKSAARKSFLLQLSDHPDSKKHEYALAYPRIVGAVSRILDLDPSLVLSVMKAESHYNPDVTSWVGARGLMQIMPGTGARIARLMGYDGFHPDELYEPEVNITFGAWYLNRLLTYYKGDLLRAVAAYNAGPEAVDRWSEQTPELELDEFAENIPFQQTHQYVRKVLKFMDVYHRIHMKEPTEGLNLTLSPQIQKPESSMEMF